MKKLYIKPEINNNEYIIEEIITASTKFTQDFGHSNDENVMWNDII